MNIVRSLFTVLARFLNSAWQYWMRDIRNRTTLKGKLISVTIGLLVICCACSFPISLVNSSHQQSVAQGTMQNVAIAQDDQLTQGTEVEPSPTVTIDIAPPSPTFFPTATHAPTSTATPPATLAPTRTPEPTATNVPTQTPEPTALPKPTAKPKPTAQPQAIAPITSGVRVGAVCRDGTRSSATGRGACSHHGGVARWLYR